MSKLTAARYPETVLPLGLVQEYPPRVRISCQGEPATQVLFVENGLVALSCAEADGRSVIVGLRSAGSMLGAPAAILGRPYTCTVISLTPCKIRWIRGHDFLIALKTEAPLSWMVHELHSTEICNFAAQMAGLGALTGRQRLEDFLWVLSGAAGSREWRGQLPFTYAELAQVLVMTPQYLSGLFNQLEQDGLLKRHKGWILIPDRSRLFHQGFQD